jgi:hypothetical protein
MRYVNLAALDDALYASIAAEKAAGARFLDCQSDANDAANAADLANDALEAAREAWKLKLLDLRAKCDAR